MTCIEIDLEDYKDEVKYTFCDNNNCLANSCSRSFKNRFKTYIDELEKELTIYSTGCKRTPITILKDLAEMYADLN